MKSKDRFTNGARWDRMYRQEALDYYLARTAKKDILQIPIGWTRWTFGALVALGVVALLGAVSIPVQHTINATAVFHVGGVPVSSSTHGVVLTVHVENGQDVTSGQRLLSLTSSDVLRELDRELNDIVTDLRAEVPERTDILTRLRGPRTTVRSLLSVQELSSPAEGIVNDLKIRPGQELQVGTPILWLRSKTLRPFLVMVLPIAYKDEVHPGLRLKWTAEDGGVVGYGAVEHVAKQPLSSNDVQQFFGGVGNEVIATKGPAFMVWARVTTDDRWLSDTASLNSEPRIGIASIGLQSPSLLVTLVPELKGVLERSKWLPMGPFSPSRS